MGTPDFSVGTLEALIEAGHEVCLVVTQPDKPKGRGKEMQPTPVKAAAMKHDPPFFYSSLQCLYFRDFQSSGSSTGSTSCSPSSTLST